jgi:hypothetical protein
MIRHVWSVLCNNASVDIDSGSVSLFNLMEQLTVFTHSTDEIILPIRFEIFSLWTYEEDDATAQGEIQVTFCDPDQTCHKHAELDIDLTNASFSRTRIRFEGLKIKGPGKYQFKVEFCPKGGSSFSPAAILPLFIVYQSPPEEITE